MKYDHRNCCVVCEQPAGDEMLIPVALEVKRAPGERVAYGVTRLAHRECALEKALIKRGRP